jgi:hypothetical protein
MRRRRERGAFDARVLLFSSSEAAAAIAPEL